jgi:carbohydrate kinase (thermoresistant glucokinase family)
LALTANGIQKTQYPLLVVVMGVSGTGKTTLATEIANTLDMTFFDADSLHCQAAIQKMSQGIALTDEQRIPWIARICSQLNQFETQGKSCVLAYSGLKRQHRQLIFSAYQHTYGILLNADQAIIKKRLQARKNHFMSPALLNSQIADMEPIVDEITLLNLSLNRTLESLLLQSISFIKLHHSG